jgi:hypothetical protein
LKLTHFSFCIFKAIIFILAYKLILRKGQSFLLESFPILCIYG